ncbi:MAG: hypothetical protein ACLFQZ_00945 [Spirochaetaceae bacterium]
MGGRETGSKRITGAVYGGTREGGNHIAPEAVHRGYHGVWTEDPAYVG